MRIMLETNNAAHNSQVVGVDQPKRWPKRIGMERCDTQSRSIRVWKKHQFNLNVMVDVEEKCLHKRLMNIK